MTAATTGRMPEAVPDERIDELYRGALEDFTPGRNALAKELRSAGEAEAATWVKGLRKPTRAAWIVNQLSSRRRADLEEALERGEELRDLQEGLLAGKVDRDRLRDAARSEQRAIESLMRTAEGIGREHGVGAQVLDRVAETLQAASSDPEVAAAIGRGRLEREARATSLGLTGSATAIPKGGRRAVEAAGGEAKEGKRSEAAAKEARREAARRRRAAERTLAAAQKRIERERGMVERMREELGEREERLAEAEREAEAARAELHELDGGGSG